ncbi:FK506-binding protein 1A [Diplogelasinospora grovesii]|uniref:peptidylprolyl isomerase n=1 Tax=Diplogelasinospora grovesii TaxID=303347 RepID=A0AAN6S552_9PEZI|nr:FK506-binding protein 1A [Diplogelasinospora grovesii]
MTIPQVPGVEITTINEGQGTREVKSGDNIQVHYKGTLTNNKEFDQSYNRGSTFDFQVGKGSVIKGWDQGLIGMKIGEKRKLVISPEMAYGNRAVGGDLIPANSTLIFETELIGIKGVTPGQ